MHAHLYLSSEWNGGGNAVGLRYLHAHAAQIKTAICRFAGADGAREWISMQARVPPNVLQVRAMARVPSDALQSRIVHQAAVDNTVFVTFMNVRTISFALNWAAHLAKAKMGGGIVGFMNMRQDTSVFRGLSAKLSTLGVATFCATSPQAAISPQGGRWFHVIPLLLTGVRVILSDVDVVWLRSPLPYLRELEEAHPQMDFAISSDAQSPTDGRRILANSSRALDIEAFGACSVSLNVGVVAFAPSARAGAIKAIHEVERHLNSSIMLRRVDQGPINHVWKRGPPIKPWSKPLHAVRDASGSRLCGLCSGVTTAGVLPIALFGNVLTHSVLRLHAAPFAVHATFLRKQEHHHKVAALREAQLFVDDPAYYRGHSEAHAQARGGMAGEAASRPRGATAAPHGASGDGGSAHGFISYTPRFDGLPEDWLRVDGLDQRGGVPLRHMRLMQAQLVQLRNALFVARMLRRALILPPVLCTCELGTFIHDVRQATCVARGHRLRLPYNCTVDHYLDPPALAASAFETRERGFLSNSRVPASVRERKLTVVPCASASECNLAAGSVAGSASQPQSSGRARGGTRKAQADHGRRHAESSRRQPPSSMGLAASPNASQVVALGLRSEAFDVLHFEDMRAAFGSFDAGTSGMLIASWHRGVQQLLSGWCCTSHPAFGRTGGVVPYLLPPLAGQRAWRGSPELRWAAQALKKIGV